MEKFKWIFDGIGTEIISLVIGSILGGGIGYKIGIHVNIKSIKQNQKAGNNSSQTQLGEKNVRQTITKSRE